MLEISAELLESEELVEREKQKTLHRKHREFKEKDKQKKYVQPAKHKNRSGEKKKGHWDDEDY